MTVLACIAWHRYRTAARSRVLAMCIAAAALALGVSTAMTVRSGAATGFIQASGTQLTLNGQPFRFTGFNDYVLPSTSPGFQCGGAQTDAYRDHVMQEAHDQAGSTVMRTWFFQSYQNGDPNNFAQFDAVLAAAAAHGVMVIPVLTNEWGACENNRPNHSLAWYQAGYLSPDPGYSASFKDFALRMAAHYANDARIAFWQLVNEAETKAPDGTCDNNAGQLALRAFADDMTAAIKQVDPNHLVSLGTMGGGQCGTQGSGYQYVHAGLVDLCEVHDYWGAGSEGDQWNGFAVRQQQCAALGKPLFVGEAGLSDSGQTRATEFDAKLAFTFNGGGVGFLIWCKGSTGAYNVTDGDPTEAVLLHWAQLIAPPTPTPVPTPVPLSVSLTQPAAGSTITDHAPAFTGTAAVGPGINPSVTVTVWVGGDTTAPPLETLTAPVGSDGSYTVVAQPALTDGSYTAQASITDTSGGTAQSATDAFTVTTPPPPPAPTATALASSENPATVGDTISLTATVSAASGPPDGSVTFADGVTALGASSVDPGGIAVLTTVATSTGAHAFTATYTGTSGYAPSSGNLTVQVQPVPTSAGIASSVSPSVSGQAVTFTATVTPGSSYPGAPTGTVAFTDGGSAISACTPQALSPTLTASCTIAYAAAGAHLIAATYSGDVNFASSAAQLTQTVSLASTTLALTTSVSPAASNQPVTYIATVVPVAPGAGAPSGTVAFADASQPISACAKVAIGAGGTARCTVSYTSPGTHAITASYAGDAAFLGAQSGVLSQLVLGAANTGAQPMAYWLGKTGQGIISGGYTSSGVCKSGTWLRGYHPFQDLKSTASCSTVASYVSTVMHAATATGHTSNALLKGEMLAVALDAYFGGGSGGTKFTTPHGSIGALNIDVTHVCAMTDSATGTGSCSGVFSSASTAFGGATCTSVLKLLAYENTVSSTGGTTWYAQNLALQAAAKDTFDSIAGQAAFIC